MFSLSSFQNYWKCILKVNFFYFHIKNWGIFLLPISITHSLTHFLCFGVMFDVGQSNTFVLDFFKHSAY